MSKRISLIGVAALCFAFAAVPAFAAKGGGGGSTATISFANTGVSALATSPSAGSPVSFAVTANVKPSDVGYLWVANVCTQNGVTISAEYHGVQNWVSGPFTAPAAGAQCTAFVTIFPDVWTALKGGSMSYSVAG